MVVCQLKQSIRKKEVYYDEKGNITRTRLADENNELREAGKVQSFFSNIFED